MNNCVPSAQDQAKHIDSDSLETSVARLRDSYASNYNPDLANKLEPGPVYGEWFSLWKIRRNKAYENADKGAEGFYTFKSGLMK